MYACAHTKFAKLTIFRDFAKPNRPKRPIFGIKTQKITFFCIFLQKDLVSSKKSTTFAPAFKKSTKMRS